MSSTKIWVLTLGLGGRPPRARRRWTATDVRALLRQALAPLERQAHALDVSLTVVASPDLPAARPAPAAQSST